MSWSAPARPSWLTSDKKGSPRKQEEFFKRLQRMKESLIKTEEHNLKNAIERMESRKFGGRMKTSSDRQKQEGIKLREFDSLQSAATMNGKSRPDESQHYLFSMFKDKNETTRSKYKRQSSKDKGASTLYRGKGFYAKGKEGKPHREIPEHRYSEASIFSVKDKQIAKIATNLHNFNIDDSYSLIRNPDYLPSIPTVGHRVSITNRNRFRAMTWESEFSELPKMTITRKQADGSSYHKNIPVERRRSKTELPARKSNKEFKFDVNPCDKEIFKHLNTGVRDASPSLPTPPVNSRLASYTASKVPKIILPEVSSEYDDVSLDSSLGVGDLNNAMQRFVMAHADLENLKEELENIAHLNEDLANYEDIDGCSTKL